MVGILSLGGQASIEVPGREDIALDIINRAIDLGINYIDTAAAYGRQTATVPRADAMGTSERNLGQVLKYGARRYSWPQRPMTEPMTARCDCWRSP